MKPIRQGTWDTPYLEGTVSSVLLETVEVVDLALLEDEDVDLSQLEDEEDPV